MAVIYHDIYGPWPKPGANYVPLPDDTDVLPVGLNRAVALVTRGGRSWRVNGTGAGPRIRYSAPTVNAGPAIWQDPLGTVCSKSRRGAGGAKLRSARTSSHYGVPYRQASRMARASLRTGAGAFSTNRALRLAQSTDLICSTMT